MTSADAATVMRGGAMLTTRHPVDFPYTSQEER
jgi:hypothetical protein